MERETAPADLQLYEAGKGKEALGWKTCKAIIRRLNLIQETVGLSDRAGKNREIQSRQRA